MSLGAAHPDLPSADKTQKASARPGAKEGSSDYFQRSQTGIRTKCEARVRRGDSRAPEIRSKSGRGERDGKRHKLLSTDGEQGWDVGSLNWALAAKEEAGQPKTAGCG